MSREPLVVPRGGRPGGPSPPSSSSSAQQQLQSRRALTTLTLGLAQAFAALSWGNGVGVAIGAATFAAGAALALLSSSPSSSASASAPPRSLRRVAQALSAYALALLVVRFASLPDPQLASFPSACPPGLQGRHGCSRIAADGSSHRPPSPPLDAPFRARASLADVERELLRWVRQQSRRVTVLRHVKAERGGAAGGQVGFLHIRAVTPLMGFADDFFARYRCAGGEAVVEVQGQLRLGVGDAGVNVARNAAVLAHLREAAEKGALPAAARCH